MARADEKPKTMREKRREKRTREIVNAAMRIVVDGGLEALTMPRLAEEAEAAVGALYRYFSGKDALMVALQVEALDVFMDYQEQRLAAWSPKGLSATAAALAEIVVVAQGWTHLDTANPPIFRLLDGWVSDLRQLLTHEDALVVQQAAEPAFALLGESLERAEAVGAVSAGDPLLRTMVMWAGLHGLSHMKKRDRTRPPELSTRLLTSEFLRSMLIGWGASAADAAAAVEAAQDFQAP